MIKSTLLGSVLILLLVSLQACAISKEDSCALEIVRSGFKSPLETHVMVVAHRGAHNNAPENSRQSILDAIEMGVDIIELDVRLSRDGVPVLMHDESIDRTTNGTGLVNELPFEKLNAIYLNAIDQSAPVETIPTLAEAIELSRGRILLHIDLKDYSDSALKIISSLVLEGGVGDQVSFYHRSPEVLSHIRDFIPKAILMPMANNPRHANKLAENGFKMIHLRPSYMSPQLSSELNYKGAVSWVNALKEPDKLARNRGAEIAFRSFLLAGVDIIQTDEPELLIKLLEENNLRHTSANESCEN